MLKKFIVKLAKKYQQGFGKFEVNLYADNTSLPLLKTILTDGVVDLRNKTILKN